MFGWTSLISNLVATHPMLLFWCLHALGSLYHFIFMRFSNILFFKIGFFICSLLWDQYEAEMFFRSVNFYLFGCSWWLRWWWPVVISIGGNSIFREPGPGAISFGSHNSGKVSFVICKFLLWKNLHRLISSTSFSKSGGLSYSKWFLPPLSS